MPAPPIDFPVPLETALAEWLEPASKSILSGLKSLGLETVGDLLTHYPRRHEDRTRFDRIPNQPTDRPLCMRGEIVAAGQRFMAGRRRFFEATLEDPDGGALGGRVVLRWFNMPYLNRVLAVGMEMIVFGQPKMKGKRLVIDHPDYETIEGDTDNEAAGIHMGRFVPVYPLTGGVGQKFLRALIHRALESVADEDLEDRVPIAAPDWNRATALRAIHFPGSLGDRDAARRYLALEEFTLLQVALLRRRAAWDAAGGKPHAGSGVLMERFLAALPYTATAAQQRAIAEIRADLASERPMNRLLQGDVGSGKTLVAAAAMTLAIEGGHDAALMAPTQILAEQHFRNLSAVLEPLGVTVRLKTGSRESGGALPLFASQSAWGSVTIGTHALIHASASDFEQPLGLVVIDEQHKFGVAQRDTLVGLGDRPDVLIMTATPIPRTLTLSVYGDLDVSVLDEMPAGRGRIVTGIRDTGKIEAAAQFLREQLAAGRQAYLVYPLIEESEKAKSAAAAKGEYENWSRRLAGFACGLLHGKMSADEKDATMERFRRGDLRALVATTVIEVGVDVPNATVMIVFNAERYGLAQLHQLRGRVGRGEHKSWCVLMVDPGNPEAVERLKILEETRDGFRIAEADLAIRGPGEVLGTAQSGLPDMSFPEFLNDAALVKQARDLAHAMEAARRAGKSV